MAFVAWIDNNCTNSFNSHHRWASFKNQETAEAWRNEFPSVMSQPHEIEFDEKMPPGKKGANENYPRSDEDYAALRGEIPDLVMLLKYLYAQGIWGHAPHWIAAAIAAQIDERSEDAKACLEIAFKGDKVSKEVRDDLFKRCRLIEDSEIY